METGPAGYPAAILQYAISNFDKQTHASLWICNLIGGGLRSWMLQMLLLVHDPGQGVVRRQGP